MTGMIRPFAGWSSWNLLESLNCIENTGRLTPTHPPHLFKLLHPAPAQILFFLYLIISLWIQLSPKKARSMAVTRLCPRSLCCLNKPSSRALEGGEEYTHDGHRPARSADQICVQSFLLPEAQSVSRFPQSTPVKPGPFPDFWPKNWQSGWLWFVHYWMHPYLPVSDAMQWPMGPKVSNNQMQHTNNNFPSTHVNCSWGTPDPRLQTNKQLQ